MRFIALVLTALLFISGCSWLGFGDDKDSEKKSKTEGYTEKDFYDAIQRSLNAGDWGTAIENLQSLEAQFPFGNYADQAQLELIFAQYQSAEFDAAIGSADRFIRLHPRHPNVDYALYMKGLAAFSQSRGFFDNFLPVDPTKRDPGAARDSFATFSELVNNHPTSSYAADARKRMIHLRNLLAYHEIHAANYYFKRGAYLAAANRGRYVVENFQMTPAVPDGLAIMAQAYHMLGYEDLATNSTKVLATNYPGYPYLNEQGELIYQKHATINEKSWLSRLSLGLYKPANPPAFDTRDRYDPVRKTAIDTEHEEKDAENTSSEATDKPKAPSWLHWLSFGLID